MMQRRIVFPMAGLVSMALVMTWGGCGKVAEKAVEKGAEKAMEHAIKSDPANQGKDVNVDIRPDGMSMQVKGKDGAVDMNIGDGKLSVKDDSGKQQVVAEANDDSFTMKTADGMSMTSGAGAAIPPDFPKDVPVLPDAKVTASTTMSENEMFMIQLDTAKSLDDVVAFYKKDLTDRGWTEETSINQAGDNPMTMLSYKREGRRLMVTVVVEDGKTTVHLQTLKE